MANRILFALAVAAIVYVAILAVDLSDELHRFRSDDPEVWEQTIEQLEARAAALPERAGNVIVVGAASVRFWDSAEEDLAPLPVRRFGFGGAKIADLRRYLPRLVRAGGPAPRAVVVVVGTNDLFATGGNRVRTPDEIAGEAADIADAFQQAHPGLPLYFVAIHPAMRDPQGHDPFSETNLLLEGVAGQRAGVGFIDPNDGLYTDAGALEEGYRAQGRSGLGREGYRVWSAPIRERLRRDLARPKRDAGAAGGPGSAGAQGGVAGEAAAVLP